MRVDARTDRDDRSGDRGAGDEREEEEREEAVPRFTQRDDDVEIPLRVERRPRRVALDPREERDAREAHERQRPQQEGVLLEAVGERRRAHGEGLVRLLRKLVEVVVEDPHEHACPDGEGDRRVGAALVVAERGGADRGDESRRAERDELGLLREEGVRDESDGGADEQRHPREALALEELRLRRATGGRRQEPTDRERRDGAPRGERGAEVTDVEVEGRVLGRRLDGRADPHVEVVRAQLPPREDRKELRAGLHLGGERGEPEPHHDGAEHERHETDEVAQGATDATTDDERQQPGDADPEEGHGDAEDAAARSEAGREPDGCEQEPRETGAGAGRTVFVPIEHGDGEAAERHGDGAHGDDVPEHRPRLHEVERHRREDGGGVEPCALVDQPRDEAVRGDDPHHPPERERRATGPHVEPEELEAERDGSERELGATQVVEVRERVVGRDESEGVGAEEVEREPARKVGDVQLEGIPEPARREGREDEEEEGREGSSDRERPPPLRLDDGRDRGLVGVALHVIFFDVLDGVGLEQVERRRGVGDGSGRRADVRSGLGFRSSARFGRRAPGRLGLRFDSVGARLDGRSVGLHVDGRSVGLCLGRIALGFGGLGRQLGLGLCLGRVTCHRKPCSSRSNAGRADPNPKGYARATEPVSKPGCPGAQPVTPHATATTHAATAKSARRTTVDSLPDAEHARSHDSGSPCTVIGAASPVSRLETRIPPSILSTVSSSAHGPA